MNYIFLKFTYFVELHFIYRERNVFKLYAKLLTETKGVP